MTALEKDFCDGANLCHLLELVTGQSVPGFPSKKSSTENVALALDFLANTVGFKSYGINVQDIEVRICVRPAVHDVLAARPPLTPPLEQAYTVHAARGAWRAEWRQARPARPDLSVGQQVPSARGAGVRRRYARSAAPDSAEGYEAPWTDTSRMPSTWAAEG